MKGLLVLIVLVGVALWAVYQFGGFSGLDPQQQLAELQQKVQPGMTWEQVADIREPRKFYVYDFTADNPERMVDFNRTAVADMVKNNGVESGFKYRYTLSEAAVFEVDFDGTGKVVSAGKGRSTADLFTLPGGQSAP